LHSFCEFSLQKGKIMETIIETQTLTKKYTNNNRSSPALASIDLSIEKGELYGIIGPDGAGKTTLIRILATVIEPTAGVVQLAGFNLKDQAEQIRSRLGYMPQAFSLYPDLTVMENLRFFSNINGVPPQRQNTRIEELLNFAGLSDFPARRGKNLSGGMQKKLALACALVHEPEILLLDEPTTGVDPTSRRQLWQLLAKVIQQGKTIIVSTPYMDEAERCSRVSMMDQGMILVSGTPHHLTQEMPFRIIEVKAKPRSLLRQIVDQTKGILGWRAVGDRLRLSVTDPTKIKDKIYLKLTADGAQIGILREAPTQMEDVFIYLVEQQEKNK
jgi:ABC-2 type transport system ATP-binding protein